MAMELAANVQRDTRVQALPKSMPNRAGWQTLLTRVCVHSPLHPGHDRASTAPSVQPSVEMCTSE